ncbi:hypothetical protein BRD17_04415 [Halobacteriales archaeon SW_7_68_16]|nr:MAG: hypothetical protein BRD17_04415 [Halobacteriales archaeon SW_7_68_16]
MAGLEAAVRSATGWGGVAIIAAYSFLIAIVLPLPSEVVLVPVYTETLSLGLPTGIELVLVMFASGLGKAAGSVIAFRIGHEAKRSGPVIRLLRRSRFDVVEWSERRTVALAKRYGYVGMAGALCVPGFPDTISIYAFSVLEESYMKFAGAAYVGSVGRLAVTVTLVGVVGKGLGVL